MRKYHVKSSRLSIGRFGYNSLQNLRPFRTAISFTESFAEVLKEEFALAFGRDYEIEEIIERLYSQDDEVFLRINNIYQQRMGSPIPAAGQESLHDFIRVAKEMFCGPGKHFAGIVIIFDEFGRYLEFSVQKPHIAGPGALQQLFECVQAHRDRVSLLAFVQYELKAYIAPCARTAGGCEPLCDPLRRCAASAAVD